MRSPLFSRGFRRQGIARADQRSSEQSVGRSRYDGMNVSYRRRLSHRFSVNSVTYFRGRCLPNGAAASFRNRPSDVNNLFRPQDLGPPQQFHALLRFQRDLDLPWGFMSQVPPGRVGTPLNATPGIDVIGQGRHWRESRRASAKVEINGPGASALDKRMRLSYKPALAAASHGNEQGERPKGNWDDLRKKNPATTTSSVHFE